MPVDSVPVLLNRDNNGSPSDKLLVGTENIPLLATTLTTVDTNKDFREQNMQQINESKDHSQTKRRKVIKISILALLVLFVIAIIIIVIFVVIRTKATTHAQESKVNKTQVSANASSAVRFQPDITTVQQSTKKVLFVIADGIPADVIEAVSITNIRKIIDIGRYKRAYVGGIKGTYSETPTVSAPGYMDLITGTWANKHNVYDNAVKNPNYHYKNIFRLLKEQEPQKKIAIFSTWTDNRIKLVGESLPQAGEITFDYRFDGYELDQNAYPHDPEARYIYYIDERVINETVACIRTYAPDLSWVYLEYTDDVAHKFGDSDQFNQSILILDNQIGRIWEAIEYRQKQFNEDWLMIITTDHGREPITGLDHGRQSNRERTTWIVINKQDTNDYFHDFQPAIVDLLPTMTRFLGISIPLKSARELDGVPLIGNISLAEPEVNLLDNRIQFRWKAFDHVGNVTIWLSTTNTFKSGTIDHYHLIGTVPIDKKTAMIDIQNYPSNFYKIVLAGRHNMINKWIFRPGYDYSQINT